MSIDFLPNSLRTIDETDEQWLIRRARIVQIISNAQYRQYISKLLAGDEHSCEISNAAMGKYDGLVEYPKLGEDDEDAYIPSPIVKAMLERFDMENVAHEILVLQGDYETIMDDADIELLNLITDNTPRDPFI